ncbi:MAG TPA: hypothetical protein VNI01_00270 [Elusimicrobiota bacterium]|jgi:hypothetical protein|nr:hypothetical protein [Elusimicrobiota bacterium]
MAKTQEATRSQAATDEVSIDYPQEMECISSPTYTFRIAVEDGERVEVSIDDSDWQTCRHSGEYWWFDWQGYAAGRHGMVARVWTREGRALKSKIRRFKVYPASGN